MVPSLPLLSRESSVFVKKTLIEKTNKQKKTRIPVPRTIDSSAIYMMQHITATLPKLVAAMMPTLFFQNAENSQYQLKQKKAIFKTGVRVSKAYEKWKLCN